MGGLAIKRGMVACVVSLLTLAVQDVAVAEESPLGSAALPRSVATQRPAIPATPGAQLWVQRYNENNSSHGNNTDEARSVAVSQDGTRVYVTGYSAGPVSRYDYATIAYDAPTGSRLWTRRYNGPANSDDLAYSVAVSPDGTKVFVTGSSVGSTSLYDFVTIAYAATTGDVVWARRYNDPENLSDGGVSLAVSPDGTKVFVTGNSSGSTTSSDYTTIAYDASTATRLWTARYKGPANGDDEASSVAASPDGTKVFVTGYSSGSTTSRNYVTIAYDASFGTRIWARRYNGPANGEDQPFSLAVSPDGTKVFVTGYSIALSGYPDYATIGYDASTGIRLWTKRYNGPTNTWDQASSVAVSSDGATVFVTGYTSTATRSDDFATIAYDASIGTRVWIRRYNGPQNSADGGRSLAVSPDGSEVFVTGYSIGLADGYDYATVAYDASSGAPLWSNRYTGLVGVGNGPSSLAVSRDGTRVFVTGGSGNYDYQDDYATVAYSIT